MLFCVLCAVTCLMWVYECFRNSNDFYLSFFVCYYFGGLDRLAIVEDLVFGCCLSFCCLIVIW